jgi:hypothetical protein
MKTSSWFLFFFVVSVAAIVLNEGAVGASRVLKKGKIVTAQADKIPCDHHNLFNGYYEVYINSLGPVMMKTTNAASKLKINKLPSGPSGGVGHKYINADGSMKASVVPAQKLITTTPFNKLPSGPSDGVGHSNND